MLLNIDKEFARDARRILTLLCCAKRPLTVSELIDGTAVELGDNPRLNLDGRLYGEDAIRSVCPGLIEVDAQPDNETSTVRIAHFSVQEYLESERILDHKAVTFSVRRLEAHAEIASICLTYLLEPAVSRDSMERYPFALYAAKTWPEHFRDGDKNIRHVEHQALRLFRSSGGEFEKWLGIRDDETSTSYYYMLGRFGKNLSPVYWASHLRLDLILSKLLCENPSSSSFSALKPPGISDLVNAQGGSDGNALQAASAHGYEKVVQLLLENGANVNVRGGGHDTALKAASWKGYLAVVKLLLSNGANVDTEAGYFGNALQVASARGHLAIVDLLLSKGADVKAQGGYYNTALQAASYEGYLAIVDLLLSKGADVNAQGGFYVTALQAASNGRYLAIVDLLVHIRTGADVNAQGGVDGTALVAASNGGHLAIVKLLLSKGADINAQGGYYEYNTALQAASAGGHLAVVKLLLSKGADINAQGRHYGTALQAASSGGHSAVVELLLSNGAR